MDTRNNLAISHLNQSKKSLPWNLKEMREYRGLLEGYLTKFSFYGTTLPVECDHFCSLMEKIKYVVDNLHQCFRHSSCIPKGLDINEYFYIGDLYNIGNHANELSRLSSDFRMVCLDQSKESRRLSEKIRRELSNLHEAMNTFVNRSKPIEKYLSDERLATFN